MDGLSGLEKVFKKEFPKAKVQRCQVHVTRNVLAKVPRKLNRAVTNDLRSLFLTSSKEKALKFFPRFKDRWENEIPLDVCLTFFKFSEEEWISLRTTNIIEYTETLRKWTH